MEQMSPMYSYGRLVTWQESWNVFDLLTILETFKILPIWRHVKDNIAKRLQLKQKLFARHFFVHENTSHVEYNVHAFECVLVGNSSYLFFIMLIHSKAIQETVEFFYNLLCRRSNVLTGWIGPTVNDLSTNFHMFADSCTLSTIKHLINFLVIFNFL